MGLNAVSQRNLITGKCSEDRFKLYGHKFFLWIFNYTGLINGYFYNVDASGNSPVFTVKTSAGTEKTVFFHYI